MRKQDIILVLISAGFLVFIFVLGVSIYKNQQAKKYEFMAQENASTFAFNIHKGLAVMMQKSIL